MGGLHTAVGFGAGGRDDKLKQGTGQPKQGTSRVVRAKFAAQGFFCYDGLERKITAGGRGDGVYEFLDDIHRVLAETLAEVDRICRKNGIPYAISGGTVLGAVRHAGHFIPWDDDCDVELRGSAYFRFLRACKRDLDTGRFFLQTKQTEPDYPYVFAKLRRHGTTDLPLADRELAIHWGLSVDIFPSFGRLKWRWADSLSNLITGVAGALAWAPKQRAGWAAALHRLHLAAPGCRACMRLLQLMDSLLPTTGRYTLKFKFGYHQSFETVNTLPPRDMLFEGMQVLGPADPQAYLDERNGKYGDWRIPQPPPKGTQYHASHILDANRDYRELRAELDDSQTLN